jgi:hypothetical protein
MIVRGKRVDRRQQLGADFVNMRQAIYSTEQPNKMKYDLEPREIATSTVLLPFGRTFHRYLRRYAVRQKH